MRVDRMSPDLASHLASVAVTYDDVGATAGALPSGYRHLRATRPVGSGAEAFVKAATALFSWQVHRRAGLRVTASDAVAAPGVVVLLGIGAGPLRLRAPCRVVSTVTESRRQGFTYGTLPGHPESGEEAFVVEHRSDDRVVFTITAFSRPATPAARAAGPVGHLIQRGATRHYLVALTDILGS